MLVPLSWLKEYVDIPVTPEVLEEKLFSCGFEVEESYEVGRDISGVVVGLVTECEKVPETHLSKCRVNAGAYGEFQVVCGADNVEAGKKFPFALVGATVYQTSKDHKTIEGTMTIREGKLRGIDSYGMLCSGTELGLTEDLYPGAGYNGLLLLPEDTEPGADVKKVTGLDDIIFDVTITANRPDCQSIFGLAREVSAVLNTKLHEPALDYAETGEEKKDFSVTVEAPDLCPRYVGHYVSDVSIAPSPAWMRRRLALVGINAISNIVDITNYVLRELGQPMHAFDGDFLKGSKIVVRRAEDGEKIVTLDEKEFTLSHDHLVIADGERAVALAGIMGGLNSEIKDTTREVVFEAAKFARDSVRKTSRALGQSSDSSAVFAKGVNEYTTVMAMKRALHLVSALGAGKVGKTHVDVNTGHSLEKREMKASLEKVNAVLGITVPDRDVLDILSRLDFEPELAGDELTIRIPAYREDMESYPDISEEIIRIYGYDHVVPTFMPTANVTLGGRSVRQKAELSLKRSLAAAGAYECVHYSFFSPSDLDLLMLEDGDPRRNAIPILNPINADLSLMRTTMAPLMLKAVQRNEKRGTIAGKLFEMGKIFLPKSLPLTDYPKEQSTLSIGVFGAEEDFFSLKALVETVAKELYLTFTYERSDEPFLHPYRQANVFANGTKIGYLGEARYEIQEELDLRTPAYVAELNLEALEPYYGKEQTYRPLPKYEIEKRDFAFVVDKEVSCSEIENAIREACPFITSVELFDVYEGLQVGLNRKSMAFSVVFTPDDHPFAAEEVDGYVSTVLQALEEKLGAVLRS